MPKLIVFLGNPGPQYRKTRHNAGWMLCDYFMENNFPDQKWLEKFHAYYFKTGNTVFLKPQTFMNVSGVSVSAAKSFFNIETKDILVVHDDIELPFSTVKYQLGGGMGGHNGLRSIKQQVGSPDFYRLRIGISRPALERDVASYVLGRFSEIEEAKMPDILEKAAKAIFQFC